MSRAIKRIRADIPLRDASSRSPRENGDQKYPGYEPEVEEITRDENKAKEHWESNFFHPLPDLDLVFTTILSIDADRLDPYRSAEVNHDEAFQLASWVEDEMPGALPRIPIAEDRVVTPVPDNPYLDEQGRLLGHPALQTERQLTIEPRDGVVNAFIKARFLPVDNSKRQVVHTIYIDPVEFPRISFLATNALKNATNSRKHRLELPPTEEEHFRELLFQRLVAPLPLALPRNFGAVAVTNEIDRSLFSFYTHAICPGRTVVPTDNTWLQQIVPIAQKSEFVKHAILSLSATYLLDYRRTPELMKRAHFHHLRAIWMFGNELKKLDNYIPEKEAAIVAAMMTFNHNEIVNWELDDLRVPYPKWYLGAKLAERVLNASNPGYKYHHPRNVQTTRARFEMSNRICLDTIPSACLFPLQENIDTSKYPWLAEISVNNDDMMDYSWLIQGTEQEQRKIIGFTGLSPKLMHTFAKITKLCAKFAKNEDSTVLPKVGLAFRKQLKDFFQWCDLGSGYKTAEDLFNACKLDKDGKVTTALEVTLLIAESYVAAAEIYLFCRFFRRPRKDPEVRQILGRLLKCIAMQPTEGKLFTAQTPIAAVFIGGVVAYTPEDQAGIRGFFEPISEGSRGNVPPAWKAMKKVWDSLKDETEPPPECSSEDDVTQVGKRHPWWEDMVRELSKDCGRLNLA